MTKRVILCILLCLHMLLHAQLFSEVQITYRFPKCSSIRNWDNVISINGDLNIQGQVKGAVYNANYYKVSSQWILDVVRTYPKYVKGHNYEQGLSCEKFVSGHIMSSIQGDYLDSLFLFLKNYKGWELLTESLCFHCTGMVISVADTSNNIHVIHASAPFPSKQYPTVLWKSLKRSWFIADSVMNHLLAPSPK